MDYKELSESLKEQGNEAFKRNDVEEAIRLYSQAIEVNPDNYVAFSNRSAAYLKSDFKSKALYDAEKCMNLAPDWIKSYNRLGVAQHALKRFDAAIDTFKRGISIEPNNQSLWGALKSCEEAKEIDKRERFAAAAEERLKEEEKLKRQNEQMEAVKEKEKGQEEDLLSSFLADIGTETSVNPKVDLEKDNAVNNSEDLLCGFFAEVSTPVLDNNSVAKVIINNITGDAITVVSRDESQMTEKYMNQELGTGHEQIQRLAAQHYQWKNLNPYFVLQLDIDATIEDIKYRYKKLSAKVHPDKMRDNESARTAFEEVKIAYQKLLDEEQRKNIIANIEVVKDNIMKERKKIEKGASVENLPSLEEVLEKEIMKHFAGTSYVIYESFSVVNLFL